MASLTRLATVLLLVAACAACGGRSPNQPSEPVDPPPGNTPPPPGPVPTPPPGSPVFVGAGDVAVCGRAAPGATAALLDGISGTVFTLGDNAYESGTRDDFARCYEPTWGRHKGRTRPSPGNHEYGSPGAAPYFEYFGAAAGPPGLGYYSFRIGEWLAISLNSNIAMNSNSAQAAWLRQTLESNRVKCTVAYFHHPLFSSGQHGPTSQVRELWRILYEHDADLVLSAHDHLYERFAPQTPEGAPDAARGIRQFTAGTGGADLYQFTGVQANSEVRLSAHGVLKLTLGPESYTWEFLSVSSGYDTGTGACH